MTVRRLVALILVGCLGIWFYKAYEPEIKQEAAKVQELEVDPFIKAEGLYHGFKYDQAIAAYREALSRGLEEPRKKEAHFRIAAALEKSKKRTEAIAAYQEAVKLYPKSAEADRARSTIERLKLEGG